MQTISARHTCAAWHLLETGERHCAPTMLFQRCVVWFNLRFLNRTRQQVYLENNFLLINWPKKSSYTRIVPNMRYHFVVLIILRHKWCVFISSGHELEVSECVALCQLPTFLINARIVSDKFSVRYDARWWSASYRGFQIVGVVSLQYENCMRHPTCCGIYTRNLYIHSAKSHTIIQSST